LEASTHSYFQDSALEFSRHHEQTYVCFIVRDPAFRLLSHFRYLRDVRGEVCARLSFNHYVDQVIEYGKNLDRNFFWTEHAQYILGRQIDLSNYPMWIEKWSAALPAERFKVIAFERLAVEPTLVLAELNEWIGVGGAWPPGFTFAPHNETYRPRSHAVHRLAATIARRIPTGSLRSAVRNGYFYAQKSDQGSDRNFALGVERMTEAFRPVCNALDELRPELSLRKRWRPEAFG
jgi:hypothetical protein